MIDFVIVFAAVAVLDWLWAKYIMATSSRSALTAALYAMCMYIVGPIVTVTYVKNPWLITAAGAGAFVGTFFTVKK